MGTIIQERQEGESATDWARAEAARQDKAGAERQASSARNAVTITRAFTEPSEVFALQRKTEAEVQAKATKMQDQLRSISEREAKIDSIRDDVELSLDYIEGVLVEACEKGVLLGSAKAEQAAVVQALRDKVKNTFQGK